jgi:biotin carboxyl carrier protein
MKYRVRVDDRTFEVEVRDIQARPVIATVEGQRFEVWPETGMVAPTPALGAGASPLASTAARTPSGLATEPRRTRRTTAEGSEPRLSAGNVVYAPIPGVIESVMVRPGEEVEVGQALCVLEAMKMKNVIRATREAMVAEICVTPGQHVKHNDVLIKYADS